MPTKTVRNIVVLAALVAIFAAALGAATEYCPAPPPVTEESYTWDFPAEVTGILNEFEKEAAELKTHAATLQMLYREPFLISRWSHGVELEGAKEHINRMGERLCRLISVQRVAAPLQQRSIDNVRRTLTDLAVQAEGALDSLNGSTTMAGLMATDYREHVDRMYESASALCHCKTPLMQEDVGTPVR